MTTRTLKFRNLGHKPVTVALTAPGMELVVEAISDSGPNDATATLELSGPDEILRKVTETAVEDAWVISLPQPESTVINNNGTTIIAGNVHGGISMFGGKTVINGVTINGRTTAVEPLKGRLRVPFGSLLGTRIDNGSVSTSGELAGVHQQGVNTSLSVHAVGDLVFRGTNATVAIGRAAGEVDVDTTNGTVFVQQAGPLTRVRSSNGAVLVRAGCPGRISARTSNSDVTVDKSGHRVDVEAHTSNGRRTVRP